MKKIFFIGINGIGMSGLAKIMYQKGYEVSGSDKNKNNKKMELENFGIKIYSQHNKENIKNIVGLDFVVRSSVINDTNPEFRYALDNNIKIITRGELLAKLFNEKSGIAISGTHGKTTTSSMLGAIMLSLDPTIIVGGILPEINSNAYLGKSSIVIAEADESDNSFLQLFSDYSIITNIEEDHLENHGNLENIKKSFLQFYNQTRKKTLINIDCITSNNLLISKDKIVTYSIKESADIYAYDIEIKNGKSVYKVNLNDEYLGKFILSVPGRHNISNSLGAIYLAYTLGVSLKNIKERLNSFRGAKRRYDILLDGDTRIIDDYAHHPTEIIATLEGAKKIENKKITVIFQPHKYSRTNFLYDEFKGCLNMADEVILLPIYSAGESNVYNINIKTLANDIYNKKNIKLLQTTEEILEVVKAKNRTYIFMGAGTISNMAHEIAAALKI